MRNENNQSRKPGLSPFVTVLMALTLFGLGICGFGNVVDEFKAGEAYTLAVIFGQGARAHRNISPVAFWFNLGWQVLTSALIIVVGIAVLCEMVLKLRNGKP